MRWEGYRRQEYQGALTPEVQREDFLLESCECGSWEGDEGDLSHDEGLVERGTEEGRVTEEV